MIGRNGERRSGISAQAARHDDDDASTKRGKTPPLTSVLDTTLNNLILWLWGMLSTPLLPSLPGPLWRGVVATDWVLPMSQIELYCIHMLN